MFAPDFITTLAFGVMVLLGAAPGALPAYIGAMLVRCFASWTG